MPSFVVFLAIFILACNANYCGDKVCSPGENCFADCAGNIQRYECPFSKALPLPDFLGVNTTALGNSIIDGGTWATPGSEHLSRGFDVVLGRETAHPIIVLQYCDDDPDHAGFYSNFQETSIFINPQGVHIVPRPECSYSATTSMYATAYNYAQSKAHQSSLSVSASVSASVGSLASASASSSYSKDTSVQTAVGLTQNNNRQLAVTESTCFVSTFDWIDRLDQTFGLNRLHPDFETQLNEMQTVSDAKYLISKYGTHFYAKGSLGGKMEQITAIDSSVVGQSSSSAVSETVSKSFSTSVGGGIGSFSASVSASTSQTDANSEQDNLSTQISQSSSTSEVQTYGGDPFSPISGDWSSWAISVSGTPVVVEYALEEILTILPDVINQHNQSIRNLWTEGVYQYFLENQYSYGNTYELITHTQCNVTDDENAYGPYAFRIVAAEGNPTIMDNFDLFRGLNDGGAFYFATNMVSQFPISIYNNIVSPISHIELISFNTFLENAANTSIFGDTINNQEASLNASINAYNELQNIIEQEIKRARCYYMWYLPECRSSGPTDAPTVYQTSVNALPPFPLFYASLLNEAQGTELLFYPSFSDATNDTMNLYAYDRTFYEVTINVFTTGTESVYNSNSTCASASSFTSGIVEIALYGSKDKLVHQQVLSSCYQISVDNFYNTFQISSQKILGEITAVSVKALHTVDSFCMFINSVKVVDLDDVVYTYTFPSPNKFSLAAISPASINAASARQTNLQNLVKGQSLSTASFIAPMTPIAASSGPWLYYLYEITSPLLFNASISAAHLCNGAGGVLSNSYHLQNAVDKGANWCTAGYSLDSDNSTCFQLRAANNFTCGSGLTGVVPVSATNCPALCYGPLPSTLLLSNLNATILESIALEVSYVTIASINSTVHISSPGSPPTDPPPPSNLCNVSISYAQTGDPWVSNGETIRQYNLAFQNTGSEVITAITFSMPSAAVRSSWNVNLISTNLFSVTMNNNGIFVGQTLNGQQGVQIAGNTFYANVVAVACN